ncbi:MAG: aminoglycoside phosphotransferase family protein [Proteobacteria bacterium]|nr:aminoglycoside phosphotransferase family protein [Pseudomonadota bacterium]
MIIEWALGVLASKGCTVVGEPQIVVKTPWSLVVLFSTTSGNFYLKQTPPDLFIEPEIIKAIRNNMPQLTPTILAKNDAHHCFLMTSCGDYSLRTKFNGTIDPKLHVKGLKSYLAILRSFESNPDILKTMGVPDWRLNRIPQLYVELLEKKEMLLNEGLTYDELDSLLKLVPKIKSTCEFLSEKKIKETLVNGDFNENNIILNEKTQQIAFIDWGESVIAHPFFTIAAHLRSVARRYKLPLEGEFLENIKQNCLTCWLEVMPLDELQTMYQQIERLQPIFSALAIYRLQNATQNKSKEMQNWFIAGVLRILLNETSW